MVWQDGVGAALTEACLEAGAPEHQPASCIQLHTKAREAQQEVGVGRVQRGLLHMADGRYAARDIGLFWRLSRCRDTGSQSAQLEEAQHGLGCWKALHRPTCSDLQQADQHHAFRTC
jgi:hypothetical protein